MKAYIERDWGLAPLGDSVRIHVANNMAYLAEDLTWRVAEEGVKAEKSGIVLPAGVIPALAEAIRVYTGGATDGPTEAKVLREWLAVEQRRVDELLKR